MPKPDSLTCSVAICVLALTLSAVGPLVQAQESGRRFQVLTLDVMAPAQREVADKIRSCPRAGVSGSAANIGNSVGSPFNLSA